MHGGRTSQHLVLKERLRRGNNYERPHLACIPSLSKCWISCPQQVMTRYSRMFQYLFRLERMQLELKRCWTAMSSHGPTRRTGLPGEIWRGPQAPEGLPSLWRVRSHMAHLIGNLQLYIQVSTPQQHIPMIVAPTRWKGLLQIRGSIAAFGLVPLDSLVTLNVVRIAIAAFKAYQNSLVGTHATGVA